MRAPSWPQSARPLAHSSACDFAKSSGEAPALAASSSLIQGRKSSGRSAGKVSMRSARSPLGSITIDGTPSSAASSMTPTQSPVLPEPVMPTQTACVVRSFES